VSRAKQSKAEQGKSRAKKKARYHCVISFPCQGGAKGKGKQSKTKSYLSAITYDNLESKDINRIIDIFYWQLFGIYLKLLQTALDR